MAYWFGFLHSYGFDNTAHGWFNYPAMAVGYDFGSMAVTLRGELSIVTSLTTYAGDLETSTDNNFFNGGSLALMLEQPLWNDNYVTLGIRVNHVKFFYPTWLLFPTFNRYYYIPNLSWGSGYDDTTGCSSFSPSRWCCHRVKIRTYWMCRSFRAAASLTRRTRSLKPRGRS